MRSSVAAWRQQSTAAASAMGNVFQGQVAGARAEITDGQHHDQHAADNERQHPRRAEVLEENPDQQTAEHRRQSTEGITETHRSTRLNSSHLGISYAVFCLKKKKK